MKKQTPKAKAASQKNIDAWEEKQAEANRISNDAEVKKIAYHDGYIHGENAGFIK